MIIPKGVAVRKFLMLSLSEYISFDDLTPASTALLLRMGGGDILTTEELDEYSQFDNDHSDGGNDYMDDDDSYDFYEDFYVTHMGG